LNIKLCKKFDYEKKVEKKMKVFKILFLSVLLIQPIKSFSANPPIVGPSTGSGASFSFETCFESGQTGGEICAFIVAVAAFITLAPPYAAVVTFRQYLENTAPLTTSDVISTSNKYAAQHYASRALRMGSKIKKKEQTLSKEELESVLLLLYSI